MRFLWLVCVLLGTLAWGQAKPASPKSAPTRSTAPAKDTEDDDDDQPATSASRVAPSATVLTIKGLCDAATTQATASGSSPATTVCETRITRAQFEKLVLAIQPNMPAQTRQQLAGTYPRLLVMAHETEKRGLEHDSRVQELLAFSRLQIFSQELVRDVQDRAAKISGNDISDFYDSHQTVFEVAGLQRIFVPNRRRFAPAGHASKKSVSRAEDDAGAAMTREAVDLQKRATGGEDFTALQKEAYQAAGITGAAAFPDLARVRRDRLPPGHALIFDLKPGQVSELINDSSGHYIYKMVSKDVQSLPEVEEEIRDRLRSQRVAEMMRQIQDPFKIERNPDYFGEQAQEGGSRDGRSIHEDRENPSPDGDTAKHH